MANFDKLARKIKLNFFLTEQVPVPVRIKTVKSIPDLQFTWGNLVHRSLEAAQLCPQGADLVLQAATAGHLTISPVSSATRLRVDNIAHTTPSMVQKFSYSYPKPVYPGSEQRIMNPKNFY